MENDFVSVILEMRSGQVATDIDAKFAEVVKAVVETGKPGELTVKLKVKPSRMGMGGSVIEVELDHDAKNKVPEVDIGRSVFFVDKSGKLTREDPAQAAMFVQEGAKANG